MLELLLLSRQCSDALSTSDRGKSSRRQPLTFLEDIETTPTHFPRGIQMAATSSSGHREGGDSLSLAALPLPLRKASGFPAAPLVPEAVPHRWRQSLKYLTGLPGKAEPFRKGSGGAAVKSDVYYRILAHSANRLNLPTIQKADSTGSLSRLLPDTSQGQSSV